MKAMCLNTGADSTEKLFCIGRRQLNWFFSKETYVDFYEMKVRWADEGLIPPYDVSQSEKWSGG